MKNKIFTVSKDLSKIHLNYKGKSGNFLLEKPDKYQVYHVNKLNITNNDVII